MAVPLLVLILAALTMLLARPNCADAAFLLLVGVAVAMVLQA